MPSREDEDVALLDAGLTSELPRKRVFARFPLRCAVGSALCLTALVACSSTNGTVTGVKAPVPAVLRGVIERFAFGDSQQVHDLLLFPKDKAPLLNSEFSIPGLPATGIASPPGTGASNRACVPAEVPGVKPFTAFEDTGPIGCNRKCVEAVRANGTNCTGIEHDPNMAGEGTCKVFHVNLGSENAVGVTCSILGQGEAAPQVPCPSDSISGTVGLFRAFFMDFIIWIQSLFGGGKSYPESAILSKAPTCKNPAMRTECMTTEQYDSIVSDIGVALETVKTNLEDCWAGNCPEADWAGCVLRVAGHDFMDYDKASNSGGSDGCTDLNFVDNKGLDACLISGDRDYALVMIYEKYCSTVSLADFLVIAAEGVMLHTRENEITANPLATKMDFKSRFRFGRETSKKCPDSAIRLPDPEHGCEAVEKTFVKQMGLTWREAAALMGVHTLGRLRSENSGYSGWWSDPDESRKFNNNYYVSMLKKGWRPQKAVCGNPHKNQWYASGPAGVKQGEQTEVMLSTDVCLMFSETDPVGAPVTKDSRVGPPVNANQSNCCAWFIVHPKTKSPLGLFTEICGLHDVEDCGSIREAKGSAGHDMVEFADNELAWIEAFLPAWTKAVENGMESRLQTLKASCPAT